MPTYSTPGVYVKEVAVFPPSVAPVATAIPAFIGYTDKAADEKGESLTGKAVRIESFLEYTKYFGNAPDQDLKVKVKKNLTSTDGVRDVEVTWDGKPTVPSQFLPYAMQLYFANGGGPCYVHSIGGFGATSKDAFTGAITNLEKEDEPTLLVFPDAVMLNDDELGSVVDAALASCEKMQDRFTIADVRNAVEGGTQSVKNVDDNFRANVTSNTVGKLMYGAAYFPYVLTNIPFRTSDAHVTLSSYETVDSDGKATPVADAAGKTLADAPNDQLKKNDTVVYAAIQAFLARAYVVLPPSGAIAGVYAAVDRTRGVWKAPANVGLASVVGPAVKVTNDLQDGLNVDAKAGKSVNALRVFAGKGTLVWGARTLAGNDNEWRYVAVRRFANFVEESLQKAIGTFVFEPNDANTWVKVRSMIENFLINQWRDGALVGAKPEHAFKVEVGLGKTMTAQDILDGYLIVDVHLAMVRPAEFIILRFMQKQQES